MRFLPTFLFPNSDQNSVNAVNQLIQTLGVKVTYSSLKKEITEHPDFPSLLAITDSLNKWKIENVSVNIDPEELKKLPLPFIVNLKERSRSVYSIVSEISDKEVIVSGDQINKWETMSWDDFKVRWSKVVTVVQLKDGAGEPEYESKQRKYLQKKIAVGLAIAFIPMLYLFQIILSTVVSGWTVWPYLILLTITAIGCYIGILLIWYEIDKNNEMLQKVCKSGKRVNCEAVLQSSIAKIGDVSWSAAGFVYFTGSFLSLLFDNKTISLLAWLNVFTLPLIFISLYYQWKVIKQWCLLCIAILTLLASEFVVNLIVGNLNGFIITGQEIFKAIFFFGMPAMSYFLLRPLLLEAKMGKERKIELNRLKGDHYIFESILMRQKSIVANPIGLGIKLGNPNGKYSLIKVCNPYCSPCAKAHPEIEELLRFNNDLDVQIIFTATNDDNDKRANPVRHLMAIAEKQNEPLIQQALMDWYGSPNKDYEAFASKYPMNGELLQQGHKLDAMNAWCRESKISFTPTYFFQGKQLPEQYKLTDLRNFIIE